MSTDSFPALGGRRPSSLFGGRLGLGRGLGLERLRTARLGVAVGLLALTLVSLWLRTRGIRFYYWIDEGLSVGIASHPLAHIPSVLRQDGSPPLYYLLLHVWMAIRGHGEVATHELSLLFALATIPAAYWAGKSLFGRRAGAISAVLAAGAPYLTTYAQETRMYALLALLSLLVAGSFAEAFVWRRRRYLPLFSLSLTAALYTHNWALFLGVMAAVAFGLCVWDAPPAQRRGMWRDGALAFGGVAVLYAPWVPTLVFQAGHTGAPWDLAPVVWSLTQGLYALVGGRGAAVALLLAGGTGLLTLRHRGRPQSKPLLAAESLLVLGIGTLLLAWLYSKTHPAWALRYLAVIVGPLLLLFALGLARAGKLGVVALVLVACFWVLDPVGTSRDSKSNVAAVAAAVRADVGPGTLILSTQPEQVPAISYYLPRVTHFATPMGRVRDPRVVDWINALSRLRHSSVRGVLLPMIRELPAGAHVLLVIPTNLASTPLWLKLIYRDSKQWVFALRHDRQLRLIEVTRAGATHASIAVEGLLFQKR